MQYWNIELIRFILFHIISKKNCILELMEQKMHLQHQQCDQQTKQINNFQAIKLLKQKQLEATILRNRIKVIEVNNDHNVRSISKNQQKIEQIRSIREKILREKRQDQQRKNRQQNLIESRVVVNKANKQAHKAKIKKNFEDMITMKIDNHLHVRQEHQTHQQLIQKQKKNSLATNINKRQNVVHHQSQSKQRILEFIQRKNYSIHDHLGREREHYQNKQKKKQKEVNQLAKKELELVRQQSQSQHAYKEMKNKLDLMLGKIRREKKINKQSLSGANKENCASVIASSYGI